MTRATAFRDSAIRARVMLDGAGRGGRRRAIRTRRAVAGDSGQGLVEYGLILGLAALVTVIALVFFGGAIATALSLLGDAIDSSR